MGRAGRGGGGGGRSSGGGHSMSRSGGGHRVGGGSRAGGGGGSSRLGSTSTRHSHSSRGMHGHIHSHGYGYRRTQRYTSDSNLIYFFIALALVVMVSLAESFFSGGSVKSTINREKLDSGNAYINDCIIDELGWFDNVTSSERNLKSFYDKTGVQPYIYLKDYDASLTTDSQKEEFAKNYYDTHFENENIFLFVYFAERDVDNDVGYMAYANGLMTSSVMDSEAVEIFWNYVDRYWYSDMSTDKMFATIFDKTGSTIMQVSTTGADVAKYAVIGVVVITVICLGLHFFKQKRKAERERAEETERILNTPIQELANDRVDDLTKKYD